MFLLFLIGLGAANVKAQVRIGGNTAPNASALLDLNATDATNNGTKGLALPRVNLTSNTMLLSGVTSNLTGMMVYNTTATLGSIGVYYWNGNSWELASLPSTSAADSGMFLMSTGSGWVASRDTALVMPTRLAVTAVQAPTAATWTKIIDQDIYVSLIPGHYQVVDVLGVPPLPAIYCYISLMNVQVLEGVGLIALYMPRGFDSSYNNRLANLRCYYPST